MSTSLPLLSPPFRSSAVDHNNPPDGYSPSESLGKMFDRDAGHQEPIEADPLLWPLAGFRWGCEPLLELADHLGGKGETETEESLVELFPVN